MTRATSTVATGLVLPHPNGSSMRLRSRTLGPVRGRKNPLFRVGFWKMIIMPIWFPSCLSSSRWLSSASCSLWQYQPWQGSGLFLWDGDRRPGFGHEVPHGQRRLLKQRHQDQGPAPAKDTHQPQAGDTPCPCWLWDPGRDGPPGGGERRAVRGGTGRP